jgi:hypothetical protein
MTACICSLGEAVRLSVSSSLFISFFRIVLIIIIPGATFTLPIFANLAATLKAGGVSCQRIEFVVAVPDSGSSPFSLESSY